MIRQVDGRNWAEVAGPALLVAAAVLLALTLFTVWRPFGLAPDPLLVVVVYLAFFAGPEWGAVAGFAGGLFLDVAAGELVGLTAFSKMCVGLGFGLLARIVFSSHVGVLLLSVPIATVCDQLLYVFSLKAFGYPMPPALTFLAWGSQLALMNVVVGLPFLLYAFSRWNKRRGGGGWPGSRTTTSIE